MVHCRGSQKKRFILNPEHLIKILAQTIANKRKEKKYFIFIHFVFIWFVLQRIDDARRIDIYYVIMNVFGFYFYGFIQMKQLSIASGHFRLLNCILCSLLLLLIDTQKRNAKLRT